MMIIKSKSQGFSLVELMVVVAIIAILAGIGLPQYNQRVISAKRSDGVQMLTRIMSSQERYFANEITYTADLRDLGYTSVKEVESTEGHYRITASACGNGITQCVLLTAIPQGGQASDGNLTLNNRGARTGNWP